MRMWKSITGRKKEKSTIVKNIIMKSVTIEIRKSLFRMLRAEKMSANWLKESTTPVSKVPVAGFGRE